MSRTLSTPSSPPLDRAIPTPVASRISAVERLVIAAQRQLEDALRELTAARADATIAATRADAPPDAGEVAHDARMLLLPVGAAAASLSISARELLRLAYHGDLRTIKIGRRRLIPVSELDAFIQRKLEETYGALK
jgi:excisionase family DNA binding protein